MQAIVYLEGLKIVHRDVGAKIFYKFFGCFLDQVREHLYDGPQKHQARRLWLCAHHQARRGQHNTLRIEALCSHGTFDGTRLPRERSGNLVNWSGKFLRCLRSFNVCSLKVLYVILTGYFPFGGAKDDIGERGGNFGLLIALYFPDEIIRRQRLQSISFPSRLSKAVRDLILHMLQPKPENRFTSGMILGHEW